MKLHVYTYDFAERILDRVEFVSTNLNDDLLIQDRADALAQSIIINGLVTKKYGSKTYYPASAIHNVTIREVRESTDG